MIYTLTLNPAIDKTVIIPSFTEGDVNRITASRTDVGGKGINVSKCLMSMGMLSTAVAIFAGHNGEYAEDYLGKSGIDLISIKVEGETRTNLKIIDTDKKINTDINEQGPEVSEADFEKLLIQLDQKIKDGDILILAGSIAKGLPSSVYRDLVTRYNEKGVKVLLDADGESFAKALEAKPYMIKPNVDELSRYVGKSLETKEEIIEVARKIINTGIEEVLVSLGGDGAILVKGDCCHKVKGLKVDVLSTVGAGDSMVAAWAYGLENNFDEVKRLKLATAISAASVMLDGTQTPDRKTIAELYTKVNLQN